MTLWGQLQNKNFHSLNYRVLYHNDPVESTSELESSDLPGGGLYHNDPSHNKQKATPGWGPGDGDGRGMGL